MESVKIHKTLIIINDSIISMKLLTKSRYKLGLECPNKLYYTCKKEYANTKQEDPFLQALARGIF